MLEYIKNLFGADASVMTYVGLAVAALGCAFVIYLLFRYAVRMNLGWLILFETLGVGGVFALGIIGVPNYKFYVYFTFGGAIVLNVVMFAQEIRRDVFRMTWHHKSDEFSANLGREELHKTSDAVVRACQRMSKSDVGALILIADNMTPSILESGTAIKAEVTADLLETIFFPKTALHDGAVVISGNTVVAAGCYLPLTQDIDLPRDFGTRHRAAIGISEAMPSITAIVVSEETGIISAMHDGKIRRYLDADQLKRILDYALRLTDSSEEEKIWGRD